MDARLIALVAACCRLQFSYAETPSDSAVKAVDAAIVQSEVRPAALSCLDEPVGPPGTFWFTSEYLIWWIKDGPVPPLVTANDVAIGPVLGRPGTQILAGDSDIDFGERYGGRFSAGMWLDHLREMGIEGSYFFLGSRSVRDGFACTAGDTNVLGRPFLNVNTAAEDAQLICFPDVASGIVAIHATSRLQGAEINFLSNIGCLQEPCGSGLAGCRLDVQVGMRYLQLDEGLSVSENVALTENQTQFPLLGSGLYASHDQFDVHNRFYGGQIGLKTELWRDRLFASMLGRLALGATHQVSRIDGASLFSSNAVVMRPVGVYALPTNIGRYEQDEFSVIPEIGINVGYQLTCGLRAYIGYTLLYWTEVVRPGELIDRAINPTQLPTNSGQGVLAGPARPQAASSSSDFWAQGVLFGLEFRY